MTPGTVFLGVVLLVCGILVGKAIARHERKEQEGREAHQLRDRKRAADWL